MRISGYAPLSGVGGRNQKKRTDGSGSSFDLGGTGRSESASSAGGAGGIAGIDGRGGGATNILGVGVVSIPGGIVSIGSMVDELP